MKSKVIKSLVTCDEYLGSLLCNSMLAFGNACSIGHSSLYLFRKNKIKNTWQHEHTKELRDEPAVGVSTILVAVVPILLVDSLRVAVCHR